MSFFKKLFGIENKEELKKEPAKQRVVDGTETAQLEELLKPLLIPVTRIITTSANLPDYNTQLKSHFGGHPYFNEGEEWPKSSNGRPLEFVFQVFNQPGFALPDNIKLLQFYFDFEEFPYETAGEGWLIKIYNSDDWSGIKYIEKPQGLTECKYCDITFENGYTLPCMDTIIDSYTNIDELLNAVSPDDPWDVYDSIRKKLTGYSEGGHQLGGHPTWIQYDETPVDDAGNKSQLLLQVDSDDNAGLMWGDAGLAYIYYNPATGKVDYIMQCS